MVPRLPDEFLDCVVFLGYQKRGGPFIQTGTAFFIGRALSGSSGFALYTVTARHVIDGIRSDSSDSVVHVRVNQRGGGTASYRFHVDDWVIHEAGTYLDLAILNWSPPSDQCSYKFVPDSLFVSDEVVRTRKIGVGDDLYITGLFVNHAGMDRNVPIVRSGIIASMPLEPVSAPTPGNIRTKMEAYLVEARSIGGLSGSPVFVSAGGLRHPNPTSISITGQELLFLGVMRGHWDAEFAPSDAVVPNHRKGEVVNMGIGIVVPAPSVLKLTYLPEAVTARRELS